MILCGEYRCKNRGFLRTILICLIILIILSSCASSQISDDIVKEIKEGNIHLVLNEKTANFSLFYLTDQRYVPLFNNKDVTASYTTISINGQNKKLSGGTFKKNIQMIDGYPAYKFESVNLTVFQMFTPVATQVSSKTNGIMITYIISNISEKDQIVGLRMLLDTDLGEGRTNVPFYLNSEEVTKETLIERYSEEKFWISRNDNVSLMGSIINPVEKTARTPDYVHFASWRRFHSASWNLKYSEGRTFNNDSAVCYFYEPALLNSGDSFVYTIFLTTQDTQWYYTEHPDSSFLDIYHTSVEHLIETVTDKHSEGHQDHSGFTPAIEETLSLSPQAGGNTDIDVLQMLQSLLIQFITGEIDLSEQDLLEIENAMNRYR